MIAAVGAPMAAVPGVSRFWTAMTTNDSFLLTWENFSLGRVINLSNLSNLSNLVSAQIELLATGDFITRSNEIERVCRWIDPEDWDGDGWQNGDDCSPYDWDESWDDFWQELPEGANTNAYCWIDVRCDYSSWVSFTGDGESDLFDPSFTALAGRTYRVTLLIGKTYDIVSAHPLTVVGRSSDDIEVEGDGTCALTVVWPVDLYSLESNGRGFKMIARPSGLGGRYTWTSSCCTIYGENDVFRYGCVSNYNCNCTGCTASGYYAYEGYRLFVEGGWCGCSEEDDDPNENSPGVSVSFSKSVIFLEDAYWNTPTNEVPWQSTDTLLTCDASGGSNGGTVTFSISGGTNLIQYTGTPLPYSRSLAPNETLHFVNRYKAVAESAAANDIVVTASFVENATGWSVGDDATATAVKVEILPRVTRDGALNRHILGVREELVLITSPDVDKTIELGEDWKSSASDRFFCPLQAAQNGLEININGCCYSPSLKIIEPVEVVCHRGWVMPFGNHTNEAGWVGMQLDLSIEPEIVCFSGLAMVEEATDEGSLSGYFANGAFGFSSSHGEGQGAGDWHDISDENFFFYDCPRIEGACPPPWSTGKIIWPIPIAWGERGATNIVSKIDNLPNCYEQTFEIDAQGKVRIDKFSQWVSRTPLGEYGCSPDLIIVQ